MPEGAIRSRASEPLERQVELFKTTAFVATALVPFAAKVSVVPCCSVRFGIAASSGAFHTWLARYSANVSARAAFDTSFPFVLMRLVGEGQKSLRNERAVCHCCVAEP